MKISKISSLLVILGCAISPYLAKPHNSDVLKRVDRSPADQGAPGVAQDGSQSISSIRKDPENPKTYFGWTKEVSPAIQASVDEHYAKKKEEGDEIEQIGDKSGLRGMGAMMEKGQYDVMQRNFDWADKKFSEVKVGSDDDPPVSGGGTSKQEPDPKNAGVATAAPPDNITPTSNPAPNPPPTSAPDQVTPSPAPVPTPPPTSAPDQVTPSPAPVPTPPPTSAPDQVTPSPAPVPTLPPTSAPDQVTPSPAQVPTLPPTSAPDQVTPSPTPVPTPPPTLAPIETTTALLTEQNTATVTDTEDADDITDGSNKSPSQVDDYDAAVKESGTEPGPVIAPFNSESK